jgi:hypothetical protein
VLLAAFAASACVPLEALADNKKTVCTITVNSADEKQAFRRYLPESKFHFVELVEKGRPDWLASACRQRVSCDVLVVSGHFNGTEFFSEHVDSREYLPVEEMERASCSESCPSLFSRLKEVYLFGCNSLNAEPATSASAEVGRVLLKAGYSRADAERVSRALNARHSESNRDGMRRIFFEVPVIYGFSSTAPVGAVAADVLSRYFHTGTEEVGRGRASARLLGQFASHAMTATSGMRDSDPGAAYRREVCKFYDERLSAADTLTFIHGILDRDVGEVRMYLDRIETFAASLGEEEKTAPEYVAALGALTSDRAARERYLAFVRRSDEPAVRARMIRLARSLGWLSTDEEREELVHLVTDIAAAPSVAYDDIDLVCSLNQDHGLDSALPSLEGNDAAPRNAAHGALLACLGSDSERTRMLQTLTSGSDANVRIAQIYLEHRPVTDVEELRSLTTRIARMTQPDAQIRALNALAAHRLSDRVSLEEMMRLFPNARTVGVQRAIAGLLIRSDFHAVDTHQLAGLLREHRLKSTDGEDLIDVLIRRLQAA